MTKKIDRFLAEQHPPTPFLVVDTDIVADNYKRLRSAVPGAGIYYAVKANPDPEIVRTLYKEGASFDVASMPEFMIVHENIKGLPAKKRQDWIWDKIIYANPTKPVDTLEKLNKYKPLVTFDNLEEIRKIKRHAPNAGLALRLKVPNTGAMVELSSKFGAAPGEAVDLILEADRVGLTVEGISFHVGSQTTNFENYVQALSLTANIFKEARDRGYTKMNLLDIGGGFPARYDDTVRPFRELAKVINTEIDRLFPKHIQVLAEPGRFLAAPCGISVAEVTGKAVRDGKTCYYINDGVYHTYSGVIFDHCKYPIHAFKQGPTQICSVFGPTCDALDVVSMAENLPDLERGDLVLEARELRLGRSEIALCFHDAAALGGDEIPQQPIKAEHPHVAQALGDRLGHLHALGQGEQGLFVVTCRHGDDELVEQVGAAADQVFVTLGDGVKGAGIDRDHRMVHGAVRPDLAWPGHRIATSMGTGWRPVGGIAGVGPGDLWLQFVVIQLAWLAPQRRQMAHLVAGLGLVHLARLAAGAVDRVALAWPLDHAALEPSPDAAAVAGLAGRRHHRGDRRAGVVPALDPDRSGDAGGLAHAKRTRH